MILNVGAAGGGGEGLSVIASGVLDSSTFSSYKENIVFPKAVKLILFQTTSTKMGSTKYESIFMLTPGESVRDKEVTGAWEVTLDSVATTLSFSGDDLSATGRFFNYIAIG